MDPKDEIADDAPKPASGTPDQPPRPVVHDATAKPDTTPSRGTPASIGVNWLGVAESAHGPTADGIVVVQDLEGLTRVVPCPLFPCDLNGIMVVLAVTAPPGGHGTLAIGTAEKPAALGEYEFGFEPLPPPGVKVDFATIAPQTFLIAFQIMARSGMSIILFEPGDYLVTFTATGSRSPPIQLGVLRFQFSPPTPLSIAERDAYLARPDAQEYAVVPMENLRTGRKVTAVYHINGDSDRVQHLAVPNPVWYADLPDYLDLGGPTPIDMRYVKTALPGLFRLWLPDAGQPQHAISGMHNAYTATNVARLLRMFRELIASTPPEEVVQRFLTQHPLFLSYFAPQQLLFKPRVNTDFVADFAVVNSKRELVLVEIERPGMRLFVKKGGNSAELEHAYGQVRSWLASIDPHRDAAISQIRGVGDSRIEGAISKVRGCVIAGRKATERRHVDGIARIRSTEGERIEFLTYDDLADSVESAFKTAGIL